MKRKNFCTWTEDEDGNWFTDCDEAFCINNGTPVENGMKFCCYCGKKLREKIWKEEKE